MFIYYKLMLKSTYNFNVAISRDGVISLAADNDKMHSVFQPHKAGAN